MKATAETMLETYFQLAESVAGTRIIREHGYKACYGPQDHPVCNFAGYLNLDPWAVNQLAELARDRTSFHLYRCEQDLPKHLEELLSRAGFVPTHQLVSMIHDHPDSGPTEPLRPAIDRLECARFMANQFFSFHPSAHRELVAKATAESTLDLQWAHIGKKQLGAVMLSRATAHLGLFNLCVSANHRHRGIGTQMVRAVLSIGEQERRAVLLQCDAKLCQWYESFGFRKTAKVEVFALRKN